MAGSLTVTEGNLGWMALSVCVMHLPLRSKLIMSTRLAAMSDFAKQQDTWYSTWPQGSEIDDRALIV